MVAQEKKTTQNPGKSASALFIVFLLDNLILEFQVTDR